MREGKNNAVPNAGPLVRRRALLGGLASTMAVAAFQGAAGGAIAKARNSSRKGKTQMDPKAFVYTELQASVPLSDVPWHDLNGRIAGVPGFLDKTWFAGVGDKSVGGLYSFDSIDNAQHYCGAIFPSVAREFGVAQTTRIFDAAVVSEASLDMGSPHFGAEPTGAPGAFVYTEVQLSVPFEKAPWRDRNPVLKQQDGLLSKLWLSGLHTNTLGGVDAFDTIDNALAFAIDDFPRTAAKLNAAFCTRVFDARAAEEASRASHSPYYT